MAKTNQLLRALKSNPEFYQEMNNAKNRAEILEIIKNRISQNYTIDEFNADLEELEQQGQKNFPAELNLDQLEEVAGGGNGHHATSNKEFFSRVNQWFNVFKRIP